MIIGIAGLDRGVMRDVANLVAEGMAGVPVDLSSLVHEELELAYPDITKPGWKQIAANPDLPVAALALCNCDDNAIRTYLGAEAIANVDLYCSLVSYNEISALWREMRQEMSNRPYWIARAIDDCRHASPDSTPDMCIANVTTPAEAEIIRQSGGFIVMVATTETMGLAGLDDLSVQCSPEFTVTGDEPDYIVRQIADSAGLTNKKEMIQNVPHREPPVNTANHLDMY